MSNMMVVLGLLLAILFVALYKGGNLIRFWQATIS